MRRATAALLLLLTGASGCCRCAVQPTRTVLGEAARAPAPPPALGTTVVRVLHFGDFGERTCRQRAVASAMATAHHRAPFDVGFAVGDLLYECGPDAASAPARACRFGPDANSVSPGFAPPPDRSFAVHDAPLAFLDAIPVHTVLGNHDLGLGCDRGAARTKACLNVAHRAPQWVMPGRHYAVDYGRARFIVVDSNLVVGDYGGFSLDDEIAFVAAKAEGCRERICFLVGHHPPVTAGSHRGDATPEYLSRMARLLAAGGGRIRAYLAGHDHDLQHLRSADGLEVFISGASARSRWLEDLAHTSVPGAQLLFGSTGAGYGVLEIAQEGWRYRFEDDRAHPVYCCTALGDGPCLPTACEERRP